VYCATWPLFYRDGGDLQRADQLERWKAAALEQATQRRKPLLRCLDADMTSEGGVNDLMNALRQMTVGVLQELYPESRVSVR
jgi:hypothetical protein